MTIEKMIENCTTDIDHKPLQIKHAQTELEKEVSWLKHEPERINSVIASANRYKEMRQDLTNLENQKQMLVLSKVMIDGGNKDEIESK